MGDKVPYLWEMSNKPETAVSPETTHLQLYCELGFQPGEAEEPNKMSVVHISDVKILLWTQHEISRCDWHMLQGNDERIVSHNLNRNDFFYI